MVRTINLAWPLIVTFLVIMVWMPFEGIFWYVMSVGVLLTGLWGWVLHQRYKNAVLSRFGNSAAVVVYWAVTGGMAGLSAPAVILGLMVLKTGVHAHGAEYTPLEILWVAHQFGPWLMYGTIIGLGIGLITTGHRSWVGQGIGKNG